MTDTAVLEPGTAATEASPPTSPFSTKFPNLQIAWDSTSLGILKSCARKYQYTIIEGYTSEAQNDHIEFGILYHSATELYEKLRAVGDKTHDQMVIDVVRWIINATWDAENNRPWITEEPTKTRETLIRTVIWYLDKFRDDPIQTITLPNGKPAIEVSFRFSLPEDEHDTRFRSQVTNEEFSLCGHLDKIGSWNGGHWIVDKKTSKYELDDYYFRQYYPDNQMSLYDVAGIVVMADEIDGVIIDAAQVLVTGSRFRRQPIHRTAEQREDWLRDLSIWLHIAETYAIANHWPQNEKSCGFGKFRCPFWRVCSSDPSVRQEMLDSEFIKRPAWNPLDPR